MLYYFFVAVTLIFSHLLVLLKNIFDVFSSMFCGESEEVGSVSSADCEKRVSSPMDVCSSFPLLPKGQVQHLIRYTLPTRGFGSHWCYHQYPRSYCGTEPHLPWSLHKMKIRPSIYGAWSRATFYNVSAVFTTLQEATLIICCEGAWEGRSVPFIRWVPLLVSREMSECMHG